MDVFYDVVDVADFPGSEGKLQLAMSHSDQQANNLQIFVSIICQAKYKYSPNILFEASKQTNIKFAKYLLYLLYLVLLVGLCTIVRGDNSNECLGCYWYSGISYLQIQMLLRILMVRQEITRPEFGPIAYSSTRRTFKIV